MDDDGNAIFASCTVASIEGRLATGTACTEGAVAGSAGTKLDACMGAMRRPRETELACTPACPCAPLTAAPAPAAPAPAPAAIGVAEAVEVRGVRLLRGSSGKALSAPEGWAGAWRRLRLMALLCSTLLCLLLACGTNWEMSRVPISFRMPCLCSHAAILQCEGRAECKRQSERYNAWWRKKNYGSDFQVNTQVKIMTRTFASRKEDARFLQPMVASLRNQEHT